MIIFKHIKHIDKQLNILKKRGKKISFIPTMGALHQGHLSLINAGQKRGHITVCSIFVNPTQFNDKADFEKYPITIAADIEALTDAGCDILFLPSVNEMYPGGLKDKNPLDFGFMAQTLEGEHRPGHFGGMAQVVERLLRIVKPHKLYMGQKDYQQQMIVGQLIKKRKLNTKLVVVETMREKDGLAMSSRNVRLDKEARKLSVEVSKALKSIKYKVASIKTNENWSGEIEKTRKAAFDKLAATPGIEVEYLEVRNADTLEKPKRKGEKLVALAAVKIGGVRLIDNMLI